MTIMPMGRYAGKPLNEIPLGYLRWMLRDCDNLTDSLRMDIQSVVDGVTHPERPADQFVTLEEQLATAMGRQ